MSTVITRKRGDTYPIVANIKVNGASVDLSGSTVKFSFKPSDNTGSVTTINGVLNTEVVGEVSFTPTALDVGAEGQYLFDVERTDSGGAIATHLSGTLLLQGDVSV